MAELTEMKKLLQHGGYDPSGAVTLLKQGVGPEELRARLRIAPGEPGSLLWTHGLRMSDPEDTPWIRLSYGELPREIQFGKQYRAIVGFRKPYTMELTGEDVEAMERSWGEPSRYTRRGKAFYNFIEGDLYMVLQSLQQELLENDDAAAGNLASSILATLHIEWI